MTYLHDREIFKTDPELEEELEEFSEYNDGKYELSSEFQEEIEGIDRELESFFDSIFDKIQGAFSQGKELLAIRQAILAGNRNENKLTNMVFFARHRERQGQRIQKSEPSYQQLRREWLYIRDRLVRPTLKFLTKTTPATPSKTGTSSKLGTRIEDRTAFTPKDKRKNLKRGKVYALVLHQMAFSRGNDTKKYDTVTAHFIITPDGKIAQLHPISAYLYASNGFNKHSVSVEFAGNFPSIRGRCWKSKKFGCHKLTSAQIEAGRYLIRYLINKIGLTHILTHRQSSGSRGNDPGPDIWYHIGQWAIENLGLRDGGAGFKIGGGLPIPDSWRTWGRR